jgi:hypothetical protein
MKHRRVFGLTLGVMLLISVVATSFSQSLHSGAGPLETRAFSRSEISIIGANVPLRDITSLLPNALDWDQFLSGHDPHTRV